MCVIRRSFFFIAGTACGIYLAQNYDVPNIKKVVNDTLFTAKKVEEKYRKPEKSPATTPFEQPQYGCTWV